MIIVIDVDTNLHEELKKIIKKQGMAIIPYRNKIFEDAMKKEIEKWRNK